MDLSFKKKFIGSVTKISGEEKNKNYIREAIKARISFGNSGQNPTCPPIHKPCSQTKRLKHATEL
jgi:hypothetical protein